MDGDVPRVHALLNLLEYKTTNEVIEALMYSDLLLDEVPHQPQTKLQFFKSIYSSLIAETTGSDIFYVNIGQVFHNLFLNFSLTQFADQIK